MKTSSNIKKNIMEQDYGEIDSKKTYRNPFGQKYINPDEFAKMSDKVLNAPLPTKEESKLKKVLKR